MALKKIGVIGSGQVARVLSNGFNKYGYDVMIGSRDTAKLNEWKSSSGSKVKVGTFDEVADFGELIVLAVKGVAAEKVVEKLGKKLHGKTVIDTTNPIAEAVPDRGVLKFFTDLNGSLMEKLQETVPEANFVKSFNCVGNSRMIDPGMSEGKPTMFICGNNDTAKKETTEILEKFGWEVCDMGKAPSARAIEPLSMLWCIPGFLRNEWSHAFKLLKK